MTTILPPRAPTSPLQAQPQRYNLAIQGRGNSELGSERPGEPLAIWPELRGDQWGAAVDICAPGNLSTLFSGQTADETQIQAPVDLLYGFECSTIGSNLSDLEGKVRRHVSANESHRLEQWFWSGKKWTPAGDVDFNDPDGAGGDDPLHTNRFLTTSAGMTQVNSGNPLGVVPAVSGLLTELAGTVGGERAMIHVPYGLVPYLMFYGQIRFTATTALIGDHVAVIGSGYDGSAPDDDDPAADVLWMYATSPVEVRLGQVTEFETYNLDVNNIRVTMSQPANVLWDGTGHVGVAVGIPDPGPELA